MKRKLFPLFLILTAFFLFSCGLTDRLMSEVDQRINLDEQDQTAPIEGQQTETVQTEEPDPEPIEASPTTPPQVNANNNCYHPFFPVVEGATWHYASESDEDYALTIEEMDENVFTMTQTFDNEDPILTVDWYCSDEGLLTGTFGQVDALSQVSGEDSPEFVFNTLEWSGETLPAPELMEIGYTWTSKYRLAADYDFGGIKGTAEAHVSIDHEIVAIEEVTVQAGTFPEAYRVDSVGEIEMVLFMGEIENPLAGFPFNSTTWYVEEVGMVKSRDGFSEYSTGIELTDYSLTGE